jgi:hypothetical protein
MPMTLTQLHDLVQNFQGKDNEAMGDDARILYDFALQTAKALEAKRFDVKTAVRMNREIGYLLAKQLYMGFIMGCTYCYRFGVPEWAQRLQPPPSGK